MGCPRHPTTLGPLCEEQVARVQGFLRAAALPMLPRLGAQACHEA
jgi:hypothetical protein